MGFGQKLILLAKSTNSASWSVRCALNYKRIEYEMRQVNLRDLNDENGRYLLALNPASCVPVLIHGENVLTESIAIIEYLDEAHGPKLLPTDPFARAQARAIALHVASAIQPLQSGRTTRKVNEMREGVGHSWEAYWTHLGLVELERMLSKTAGTYCVGDSVSIADTCVPSVVYKGRTSGVDVTEFRTLLRIEDNLKALKPFISAFPFAPENGLKHSIN